jgi:hypothetical protein
MMISLCMGKVGEKVQARRPVTAPRRSALATFGAVPVRLDLTVSNGPLAA